MGDGEVVSLADRRPARDDGSRLVWVCGCGSTTHYHCADGRVICGACDAEQDGPDGEWRLRLPDEPDEPDEVSGDAFKVLEFDSPEVFFKAQSKRGRVVGMVLMYEGGAFSDWAARDVTKEWFLEVIGRVEARARVFKGG